jgi:hypothetical protein
MLATFASGLKTRHRGESRVGLPTVRQEAHGASSVTVASTE